MIGDGGLEDQYDEEDSWEAEGFLEGMKEAESDEVKKKKSSPSDEFQDGMDENIESEFEEQFGDDF
ncbi:MAG: hypothetical protein GOU98_04535 [Candidatus Altiarchaeota archaeon]|nr:hypothetical protein [Candidatus Altiarchaeota archaeon]